MRTTPRPGARMRIGASGRWQRNPLGALSRWKLFDNLRRSLVPAALVGVLVAGWLWARSPLAWTLAALSVLFLPPLISALQELLVLPQGARVRAHLLASLSSLQRHLARAFLLLSWLPHEAWFSVRAILRT